MTLTVGSKITLHSYKHDKTLHRIWETATVLADNEEYVLVANRRTKVVEANGRFWYTREPSVSCFFKKHWYNVIGIIKPTGVSFYCNISSPSLVDSEALKYIDYDLDIKVQTDYTYSVLDRNEYHKHQRQMDYPKEICDILEREIEDLKERIEKRQVPFQPGFILEWYAKYQSIKE